MHAAAAPSARRIRSAWGVRPALVLLVRLYRRVVSPVLPRACRFEPSCSAYAEEALRVHGILRALLLIARRVLRCHPFHPGGFDPVP